MKGLVMAESRPREGNAALPPWESLVLEAVGNVIEFWGFKANQGRVWGLLYLRDQALSASELQELLGLSKGAVSMVTRELEQWGVIHRVRQPREGIWRFQAETDLMKMIGRVISDREAHFVSRVKADLEEAERRAKAAHVPRPVLERMTRLRTLAQVAATALDAFLKTARLDVRGIARILTRGTA